MPQRIAIGLMSGTSADGIDAVACRVRGRGKAMRPEIIDHISRRYPPSLRARVLAAMAPAKTTTQELCRLDVELGRAFGEAALAVVRRARLRTESVAAVGSHGQTVCHLPNEGATLQLGRAAEIAERVRCPVVFDFRSADVAAGGQGAPLVPWTDWLLWRHPKRSRAVQNIGGIANVTWLRAAGGPDDVTAFDTGPGNMIIDELMRRMTNGRLSFDRGGRVAARGVVCEPILKEWLSEPYFRRRPPKSCGREMFGREFVSTAMRRHARRRLSLADWAATATTLTVETIARAYERFLPRRRGLPMVDEVILCGGGSLNEEIRRGLAGRLGRAMIRTSDELGVPVAAKEALSFALLACACLDGVQANLPRVTGARRPVVLGQITRPIP